MCLSLPIEASPVLRAEECGGFNRLPNFLDPTVIGLILIIIGVIAFVAGVLKVGHLAINIQTAIGRMTLIFAVLHILGGLAIIAITQIVR